MVHLSSRFYRCLCRVIIASMLFQTGCFSGHKTYTHLPTEPPSTLRPLLESGEWDLEVGLREESVIKVTPAKSEFGEAENLKTKKVSGRLVSWDDETISLQKEVLSFNPRKLDVVYEIPLEDVISISFSKPGKKFSPGKTAAVILAPPIILISLLFISLMNHKGPVL